MTENLPVLILNKHVLLPYQELKLDFHEDKTKDIINYACDEYNKKVLVIFSSLDNTDNDFPKVGVIGKISKKLVLSNGNLRVIINGLNRVQVKSYENNNSILMSSFKKLYISNPVTLEEEANLKKIKELAKKYMDETPGVSNSIYSLIEESNDLDYICDLILDLVDFDLSIKAKYMLEFDYIKRSEMLIKDIYNETKANEILNKIDDDLRDSFEKEQREYIIRQKISKLFKEIGGTLDKNEEVLIYNEKINELDISDKSKTKLLNEVKKYSYTSDTNPDSSVIRNYLDTVINLPWKNYSKDVSDLRKIKKTLDDSHYGLDEVKLRILEFIAIKKQSSNLNSPIICLVGPPGTGKTTLGASIANALNREFFKISVGGLSDSTELTGHRRTYLGSSPGVIMQGIKKCGTANPVILIDEVDKMVKDYQGDPASVLLDILDPKQNQNFVDFYIEEPFDLSKVLFILTANDLNNIPSMLKDRLEVIDVSSYTQEEKIDIAKKYLLPNIFEEYNMKKIKLTDDALKLIIDGYTHESGVRNLDRTLKKIVRNMLINERQNKTLTEDLVKEILGPIKYDFTITKRVHTGMSSSLGVTPYGGFVINFEIVDLPGSGRLIMTGNVHSSVEESARVALNYIIRNSSKFGIDQKKIMNKDYHVNALCYAIKKSGSSGGVALASAFISLLLDKAISPDIGFTGEIDLYGDVMKVGGIKEKIIGAVNNNFKKVFIPYENKNDLDSVPDSIKSQIDVVCVDNFIDVYNELFKKSKKN